MILQTNRLDLREMTQSDFPLLCRHLQDPEVMYAYAHTYSDAEVQQGIDRQLRRYRECGYGIWAVVLRESGELIGQCGLSMQPVEDREVLEIGYIFQKAYWHRGYATEAAVACKRYAFNQVDAEEVFSLIRDTNLASQRVAAWNGMVRRGAFVKHDYGIDMPHFIYSARRAAQYRVMEEADYGCLREFLYQAIFVPEGVERPERSIVDEPEIRVYIEDFGERAGDLGVVAEQDGRIVGAAWTRIIPAYGHVDDETPELAIGVLPAHRGYGIGTGLLTGLFDLLRERGYERLSLSVQTDNPAQRLYRRLGFTLTGERPDHAGHRDYLMEKRL